MPTYTITDPNTGKQLRVTGDSEPTEAEMAELFAASDDRSIADWLPSVGGVVGGIAGAAGGPLGAAAGAALGGGGGEGIRQIIRRVQGKSAPDTSLEAAGDIATIGGLEGAAGLAGGAIAKGGMRLIRGVSKYVPTDMVKAGVNTAVDWMPGTAGKVARTARTMGNFGREAVESPAARPRATMPEGFDRYMPNTSAVTPPIRTNAPSGLSPRTLSAGEERGISELDELLDAIHGPDRVTRGASHLPDSTPRQQLARELMRSEADDLGGSLSPAGQSMLTAEEESMFANALRELRSGSLNRAQSIRSPLTQPRALLPETSQTWQRGQTKKWSGVDIDALEEAARAAGELSRRFR